MSGAGEGDERGEPATEEPAGRERYYRGVITRVYYGSDSGLLRSEATQREYRLPRALTSRSAVPSRASTGSAKAWRSASIWRGRRGGPRVSVIRVFE